MLGVEESSAGTTPATPILRSSRACCQIILLAAGFVAFFAAEASAQSTARLIGIRSGELAEEVGDGPNSADGKVDWSQIINMPTGFADGVDATGGGGGGDVDSFAADPSSNGNFSSAAWITDLGLAGLYQPLDSDLTAFAGKTAPSGAVVGTSDSQTLTNKTLTSPIISTISNTGTLTLPTATDTLVGRATTDTLTNKTLTSPAINTATIAGGTINNSVIGGTTPAQGTFTVLRASTSLRLFDENEAAYGTMTLSAFGKYTLLSGTGAAATLEIADDVYNATTWNGSTLVPTKNAVRDLAVTLQPLDDDLTDLSDGTLTGSKVSGAVTVSGGTVNNSVIGGTTPAAITGTTFTATTSVTTVDDAYNSTSWDGNNTVPTKNAVRDQIQAMLAGGGLGTGDIDDSSKIAAIVGDESGTGALLFGTSPTITTPTLNGTPTIGDAAAWRTALGVQASDTDLDSLADGITGLVIGAGNGSGYGAATANADYLAVTGGSPTFVDLDASIGTITASDPFTLSQTYNNGAVTFEALRVDVTSTAAAAASRLLALYDDSVLRSAVDLNGIGYFSYWIQLGSGSGSFDTIIRRFNAHDAGMASTTAPQTWSVANTFTDNSNYEKLQMRFDGSNAAEIGTYHAGTGSARTLSLVTGNSKRWTLGTDGHLLPASDSAYDLGASGTELRGVYADTVTAGALAGNAWTALRKKTRTFVLFGPTTDAAVSVSESAAYYPIPPELNGANITYVHLWAVTAGTTGTTDVQIARVRSGTPVDVLSTKLTIDSTEQGSDTAASAAVINTSNDDMATNDVLRIDVDDVSSVAPKGLIVTIGFELQ